MSDGPGPTQTKISGSAHVYFCFDLILYYHSTIFQLLWDRSSWVKLVVPLRLKLESLGLESSTLALVEKKNQTSIIMKNYAPV